MERLAQFLRSFRTFAFIGASAASMMPWPGITCSALADQVSVGGDTSLAGQWYSGFIVPAFHALADVNGDGFADLIYTIRATQPYQPQTSVFVQYSDGTRFGAPVVVATDSSATSWVCNDTDCSLDAQALINAVGDVNHDGRPDILFGDGTVALGNSSGFGPKTSWGGDTSLAGQWYPGFIIPAFHALADVNGDGFADLIYTIRATQPYQPQTSVFVQYSDGTRFGAPVVVATDSSATSWVCNDTDCSLDAQALINAVGDINGDGQPDILFANGSVANLLNSFTVEPKFLIGSVIYVPPGQSSQGPSKITYASQTMTGTTVSTTDTWKNSSTAGVQISSPLGDVTITFGNGFGGSTMTSVDMQQTTSITFPYSQLPADTINHDFDQIQLFIGLNVNGLKDYLGNVVWSMDFSDIASKGFSPQGNFIQVGCLRGTFATADCAGQMSILTQAQITSPADFAKILGADPFADPATAPTAVNCNRYRYIPNAGFQYAFEEGGSPITYMVTNNNSTTNANTTSYEYSVDIKASSAKFDLGAILKASLNGSASFSWSHSSTTTNKTGTQQSSSLFLAEPSHSYAGPETIYVYQDTIFKTFMFSFVTPPPPNQPCTDQP